MRGVAFPKKKLVVFCVKFYLALPDFLGFAKHVSACQYMSCRSHLATDMTVESGHRLIQVGSEPDRNFSHALPLWGCGVEPVAHGADTFAPSGAEARALRCARVHH